MGVAFFRRFMDAAKPATSEKRPEHYRSGNDEEAKSPASVGGVRIDLADPNQDEREGKDQSAKEVNREQY